MKINTLLRAQKMMCALLAGLVAAVALTGCRSEKQLKRSLSKTLSIDCSSADVVETYDSHGGFLGDGTSFYALQFKDNAQVESIKKSGDWKPLPFPDSLKTVAWGWRDDEHDYAPMIIRDNDWDNPLMPQVEHGYYFFRDRHSYAADPKDDSMLLDESRPSYNFTLAIYDADTNRLYFSEVDT